MSLIRWDPFGDLARIQNSINRLFDDNYRLFSQEERGHGWGFPVDIKDTPEAIVVKADLPGLRREDISVSYNNNVLTIRGERKSEAKTEGENYVRFERRSGLFSRSFALDAPVKADAIKATYRDGILEINLPREKTTKEISITIE